jgi:hypothetical protein
MPNSVGRILQSAKLLHFFRLTMAEREFLLAEIISRTVAGLRSPLRTPEVQSEKEYVNLVWSGNPDIEPLISVKLSNDAPQEGSSLYQAIADQNPRTLASQAGIGYQKEENDTYGAGFEIYCDLFERELAYLRERELDKDELKRDMSRP